MLSVPVVSSYNPALSVFSTHLKNSSRPPCPAVAHTSFTPPTSMEHITTTAKTPPNMSSVCSTSVYTTAFTPP
ncbi:hypothetical protein E2C01_059212 [Portunus trituberculatus]|uniref:Uncharacterized protein n=1 Tax=Portunus trituberculatus TaxID=210409 RepID=A0A5B7H585_PORTR|nr:hypothetical protein [Portunus trituberculatus]